MGRLRVKSYNLAQNEDPPYFILLRIKNMQNYFDLLKKCKTLHWAAQVYIAVLLDEKLTNKQKKVFQDVYVEFTQNLKN
jgi:hypothetical protein